MHFNFKFPSREIDRFVTRAVDDMIDSMEQKQFFRDAAAVTVSSHIYK